MWAEGASEAAEIFSPGPSGCGETAPAGKRGNPGNPCSLAHSGSFSLLFILTLLLLVRKFLF